MLSGGTGDLNLEPVKGDDHGDAEMLGRMRSLLVFSVENQGAKLDNSGGKKKSEVMMERWKAIFSKDSGCSGTMAPSDFHRMVRRDLKVADRLVTDEQILKLFRHIDTDQNDKIDFHEFLAFVSQPVRRRDVSEEEVVNSVARGVRLALRRNKIKIHELHDTFHTFDESGEIATGELGPNDMVRFFRKVLKLTKHESSDKALHVAFYAMDDDGSGKMSLEELMDFIKFCSRGEAPTALPVRVTGLIGGMRGVLPLRTPSRRPGSTPGVSAPGVDRMAHLPFCLNGRDFAATGRLGATAQRFIPRSESAPTLPSMGMKPTQASMLSRTFSGGIRDAASDSGVDVSPTASPMHTLRPLKETLPKKRVWSGQLPGKTHGGYMLLKGAHALNQVEERLFEAGIDVRGHYHKK